MGTEEGELIEQARHDPRRFEPLYERYHSPIFLFLLRRCRGKELAADLTQQTFLKAMLALPGYKRSNVPFKAWLYRIALNEVRMHWRKRKEIHIDLGPEQADRLSEEMRILEDDERLPLLLAAMGRLDGKKARLIELRFLDGLTFLEVGQVLGIGEDAAKMRTHRVLRELRSELGVAS